MRQTGNILLATLVVLFHSCTTSKIISSWKADQPAAVPYNKIMVAAILYHRNDSLRLSMEKQVAAQLNTKGYYAVSTVEQFGRYGLEQLGQEATFLSLCDEGIDAVLTIAIVPESYSADMIKAAASRYSSAYYYDHIWNYHTITGINDKATDKFRWEMILFDVTQLKPQSVLQSLAQPDRQLKVKANILAVRAIRKMIKDAVLVKQELPSLKPF
jgi:hypothetical protein